MHSRRGYLFEPQRTTRAPRGAGMAEVFISYSQKDRALVAPIAARLDELGVDAWFDREISAGQSFGAIIRARLKEAKAVLVCWSPDAIESQWVDAEADFAREMGTYVPVFIAPCALMPPFNRIHTDDLSKWSGAADDSIWIKLVDRLAHLIGRAGLAAAARALATADEAARYDFARRYPDEPVARKIWAGAEARHRREFEKRLADARAATAAKISADRAMFDARLAAAGPAFEAWLADECRAAAKGPRPDPMRVFEPAGNDDSQKVRDEIAALSGALAQAKGRETELSEAARLEIERLSSELTAVRTVSATTSTQSVKARARGWAFAAGVGIVAALVTGLIWQSASPPSGGDAAKLRAEVDALGKAAAADRDRAAKSQADLAASQSQAQLASAELDKLRAAASAEDKKLADTVAALAEANDRATKLQADLTASQSQAQVAAAEADKLRAAASAEDKKLADTMAALAAANDRATKAQADLAASQSQAQTAATEVDRLRAAASAEDKKMSEAAAALAVANSRVTKLQMDLDAKEKSALHFEPPTTATGCKGDVLFVDGFGWRKPEWTGDAGNTTVDKSKLIINTDETKHTWEYFVSGYDIPYRICVDVNFPNITSNDTKLNTNTTGGIAFWDDSNVVYAVSIYVSINSVALRRYSGIDKLWRTLANTDINNASLLDIPGYALAVYVDDAYIKIYLNGKKMIEYTKSINLGKSKVGVFAQSDHSARIEFSNFVISR